MGGAKQSERLESGELRFKLRRYDHVACQVLDPFGRSFVEKLSIGSLSGSPHWQQIRAALFESVQRGCASAGYWHRLTASQAGWLAGWLPGSGA